MLAHQRPLHHIHQQPLRRPPSAGEIAKNSSLLARRRPPPVPILPALFSSLSSHARPLGHGAPPQGMRGHARGPRRLGSRVYQATYTMHLACQKTKEGFTEAVVKEVCKMARAAADELQWRAMEASVKEMLSLVQAKEFLKAVEDIISMVRRHGTKATRGPDGGSVSYSHASARKRQRAL